MLLEGAQGASCQDIFHLDYKKLSQIAPQLMNQVTSVSSAHGSTCYSPGSLPIFEANDGDESCKLWGVLLAVFGDDLAAAVGRMSEAVPGTEELLEDVQAASRRYGLMLEAMCLNDSRTVSPCLLYDCADGFNVLMVQQQSVAAETVRRAARLFDSAQVTLPESLFINLLSQAMRTFFDRMVALPGGLVTVQLEGCDYMFLRAEHRDEVLRDMKIGTTAGLY